jgi:hypothetical protein
MLFLPPPPPPSTLTHLALIIIVAATTGEWRKIIAYKIEIATINL